MLATAPFTPSTPSAPSVPTVVAVIAYDGISPFHLSVPSVVFGKERDAAASPAFEFRVCSAERGPLATTGGLATTDEPA